MVGYAHYVFFKIHFMAMDSSASVEVLEIVNIMI